MVPWAQQKELLMKTKQQKNPKPNKIKEILFNLGNPKELNHKQLSKLAQGFSVKYALSLEDTILEQHKDKTELYKTIDYQRKIIEDQKTFTKGLIDKYENEAEEYQKANTQLTLNVEELKTRLFGKFERRLKDFALRPDKKKDN